VTTTEERSDGISEEMAGRAMSGRTHAFLRPGNPTEAGMMRAALVAAGVPDLLADRDRARSVAVALEQQVAALSSALHVALGHAEGTAAATWAERTAELAGCRIVLNDCTSPAGDEDGDRG
jgi:hypothetical protein